MKLYGNLTNRLEENKQYKDLTVGTDITMYHWSDRTCYYVTKVIDAKHIFVKKYFVCADHDKATGMGHQDWVYFKTLKEMHRYLVDHGFDAFEYDESCEAVEEEWVYRYNKWMRKVIYTTENYCTDRELKSLHTNGYYVRYFNLSGNISIGVRDYFYDWEF